MQMSIREASEGDATAIARIYNQGIEDRGATFETQPRTAEDIAPKLAELARYPMLVAADGDLVLGWAGLSPYRSRLLRRHCRVFDLLGSDGARSRHRTSALDVSHRRCTSPRLFEVGVSDFPV
jgi:hypothetical protein